MSQSSGLRSGRKEARAFFQSGCAGWVCHVCCAQQVTWRLLALVSQKEESVCKQEPGTPASRLQSGKPACSNRSKGRFVRQVLVLCLSPLYSLRIQSYDKICLRHTPHGNLPQP